jgi:hypothetical protein
MSRKKCQQCESERAHCEESIFVDSHRRENVASNADNKKHTLVRKTQMVVFRVTRLSEISPFGRLKTYRSCPKSLAIFPPQ